MKIRVASSKNVATHPQIRTTISQTRLRRRTDFFNFSSLACVGDRPLRVLAQLSLIV